MGKLAKTDAIDAQLIACFAERVRPALRPLPDEDAQILSALAARRVHLIEMHTAEKSRMRRAPTRVRKEIQRHIDWLSKDLDDLDGDLGDFLRQSPL